MGVRALSSTSVDRTVGGVWDLLVDVRDVDGCLTDDAPVVTVTLPDASTSTPAVETVGTGVYRAEHVPAAAGRYVARAVTTSHGAVDFTAFVTAIVPAAGMPNLVDLRGDPGDGEDLGYLGPNSWTDADIQDALDAEAAAQRRVCRVPADYPDDLRQALLRRVARNLSMRRLALALARGDAEAGSSDIVLSGSDPEVRRFERPFRKLIVG
jgi:hypothetical protein